jgi:Synergist-CTERM protein sorting domain-containing protein
MYAAKLFRRAANRVIPVKGVKISLEEVFVMGKKYFREDISMKKRNRTLFIFIFALFSILVAPLVSFAAENWSDYKAENFAGGDGSQETPFLISTPEQLALLAYNVNNDNYVQVNGYEGKYFRLTFDIDLDGKEWTPIGKNGSFRGNFDGASKTIWNLVNRAENQTSYVGLFGRNNGGTIKNLNIANMDISGSSYNMPAGGLICSNNQGIVTNCAVSGRISYDNSVGTGGLIGSNNGGTVMNCTADVSVIGSENVGGLIGRSFANESESIVMNCAVSGDIKGDFDVGGLIGDNGSRSSVKNCTVIGIVSTAKDNFIGNDIGGLIGLNSGVGDVENSTAIVSVNSKGDLIGGLIGQHSEGTVTNCTTGGTVRGRNSVGGLIGMSHTRSNVVNNIAFGSVVGSGYQVTGLVGYNDSTVINSVFDAQGTGQLIGVNNYYSGMGTAIGFTSDQMTRGFVPLGLGGDWTTKSGYYPQPTALANSVNPEVVAMSSLAAVPLVFAEGDTSASVTQTITIPSTAADGANITWTAEPGSLVTITRGGIIPRGEGEVTLTATAGKYSKVFRVTLGGSVGTGKKAIYFLPGYMGSRLYDEDVREVWLDNSPITISYLVSDIMNALNPLYKSILGQNEDGTGMRVRAYPQYDHEGVGGRDNDASMALERLRSEFEPEYEVIFFPYNWLGDLNESREALEKDIIGGGYEKVVFVTHSTGGVLAASYIAHSDENKNKVEKAILVAAPLFGLNKVLQAVEGQNPFENDSLFAWFFSQTGLNEFMLKPWLKKVTKNSPTTYQLFPSIEYWKQLPALYFSDYNPINPFSEIMPITTTDKLYEILNGSGNINKNLTNGGARSHQFFRQQTLGGDIVKVLQKVPTVLIGSSQNEKKTAAILVYEYKMFGGGKTAVYDVIYKDNGDGTVLDISSAAMKKYGKYELDYRDHPGLEHGELIHDDDVFDEIVAEIKSSNRARSSKTRSLRSSGVSSEGMAPYIKLRITADEEIDIRIVDNDLAVVASFVDGYLQGFDGKDFIFDSLDAETGETKALIHMPNTGYKVSFSYGNASDVPVDFSVEVTTLDYDGFNTSQATYSAAETSANGEIIVLNALSKTVTKNNIGTLIDGQPVNSIIFYDQWEIEPEKTLSGAGATATIALSGSDVSAGSVKAADLAWSSSDPEIVSVSDAGVVTAKSPGEAVIFATARNASYKFSRSVVTVLDPNNPSNPNNPGGSSGSSNSGGADNTDNTGGADSGTGDPVNPDPGSPSNPENPSNPSNPANPINKGGSSGGCDAGFGAALLLLALALKLRGRK